MFLSAVFCHTILVLLFYLLHVKLSYSVLFHSLYTLSILFYSIPFYSALVHVTLTDYLHVSLISTLFQSTFYCIPLFSVLCYSTQLCYDSLPSLHVPITFYSTILDSSILAFYVNIYFILHTLHCFILFYSALITLYSNHFVTIIRL